MKMPMKDKKIDIFTVDWDFDDIGNQIQVTKPLTAAPMWAYFRQIGGGEYYAAKTSGLVDEEVLFVVNWRDDITNDDFVVYNGKAYDIERIDPYEGYKQDLKLYCKYNFRQEIPDRKSATQAVRVKLDSAAPEATAEPEAPADKQGGILGKLRLKK